MGAALAAILDLPDSNIAAKAAPTAAPTASCQPSGGSGVERMPLVLGPLLGGIGQDFQHFSRLMPFF